jgi:hypothetical protein
MYLISLFNSSVVMFLSPTVMATFSSDLSRILQADRPKEIAKVKKKTRFTMQITARQAEYSFSCSGERWGWKHLNPLE